MSLAHFPMFPTDFDADTGHLSLAEDGAYNRLLRLQWKTPGCKMPADIEWIYRKARAVTAEDQAVIDAIIAEFFTRKNGKIFSARMHKEYVKVSAAIEKKIAGGSKGGLAKAMKDKENASSIAMAKPCQPEPEPEPYKEKSTEAKASDEIAAKGDVPVDPIKAVFDAGIRVLGGAGLPEPKARAFLGKLRKDHPGQDGQILAAIMDCGRAGAVDPIPWITAVLSKPRMPTVAEVMAKIAAEGRPQ